MNKLVIFILMYVASFSLHAAPIVDVYGIDPKQSEDLLKKYGVQVGVLEEQLLNSFKESKSANAQDLLNVIVQNKILLINKIKKDYGLSYVDFDTIFYPTDKRAYTTIEAVSIHDKKRLRFVHEPTKPAPQKLKHDLIAKMMAFKTTWGQLMVTNQLDPKEIECPVYHCLPGFTHPQLKDDFALFNATAFKEKDLILSTIKNDPNPERREAAIFLMGHFKEPHEIISLLTNHMMDPDDGVRNAAMRVINETMQKANIHQIDVLPFLGFLDSPFDTDRNKALLILQSAADSKASKELITRHGKERLIALLHLKQPNNHKVVYAILKQISGNDFGPRNYEAWEQWFLTMNHHK